MHSQLLRQSRHTFRQIILPLFNQQTQNEIKILRRIIAYPMAIC
jgi:hypothetical protein